MEKKIIIFTLLLFLLLAPFALSESITALKVPTSVPLNQGVTATGLYVPDGNVYANKLCSFYFLDSQSNLVIRADDQFTDATGRFALPPFNVNEPLFQRENQYFLHVVCGTGTADANFSILQKQEVFDVFGFKFFPQAFVLDTKYFTDPATSGLLTMIAVVLIMVGGAVIALWKMKM